MTTDPQIRLATEIAAQFRHRPPDEAAEAIARHIRSFWDPRMRAGLSAQVEAGAVTDPLVLAAVRLLQR
ncbi:formate dehydrogenase subunit delta [Actinomadura sp. HBU206391]|uniref:formate dehydrogenase subunit delta n=1 Tax=Actinomadura sp. HBU206391 TaxID=2731692 RepID=UPI00164F967D|nr:formate dehydrogenase subunit delta [Actinomadura sp. HBU206391]MBC6460869.1 formate dehydrogenase subunit delta [Actinomadura sp. HBU206391]